MGVLARVLGIMTTIPPHARENAIDNGNFAINQRGYVSSTTLTASAGDLFGPDRWKVPNGSTGSLALTTLANGSVSVVTTGTWNQIIPGYKITSTTAIISWLGSNSYIGVGGTNYSGTSIKIGADTRYYAYVTGLTIGANTTISLQPGGTFTDTQLDMVTATGYPVGPFQRVRQSLELHECMRYFQTTYPLGSAPAKIVASPYQSYGSGYAILAATLGSIFVPLSPPMRTATPVVTIYSPVTGVASKVADLVAGVDVAGTIDTSSGNGVLVTATGSITNATRRLSVHATASCDL